MKNSKGLFLGFLFMSLGFLLFSGCGAKKNEGQVNGDSYVDTQSSVQTQATENISITTNNKYNITLDKEFYRPSMRIAKDKENYISVQQLKNSNEKINLTDPNAYDSEKLKSDFQSYLSNLTGFSPVTEVRFGNKDMCKTTTSVNAVKSDIYRYLSEGKNVYKIVVSGPEFKESDEAEKIIETVVLQ